jgi:hypothetical protein
LLVGPQGATITANTEINISHPNCARIMDLTGRLKDNKRMLLPNPPPDSVGFSDVNTFKRFASKHWEDMFFAKHHKYHFA